MNIAVVGGGASGVVAAIHAARLGASITLYEAQNRILKKLLVTGNGRCNIMNSGEPVYYGGGASYAVRLITDDARRDILRFFESIGVYVREEDDGRCYPSSGFAGSVADALRFELDALRVSVITDCHVDSIEPHGGKYIVKRGAESSVFDRVIISTGGCASVPKWIDHNAPTPREHNVIRERPALAPIMVSPSDIQGLKGVRAAASLRLTQGGASLFESVGEILFGDTYISGIAAMRLARFVPLEACQGYKAQPDCYVHIGLFDQATERDKIIGVLRGLLERGNARSLEIPLHDSLRTLVHPRLAMLIAKRLNDPLNDALSLHESNIERVAALLIDYPVHVVGVASMDRAQVMAGGVDASGIDFRTMESLHHKGLYFTGEVLDIDGDCGGHNLMWAWLSGKVAGERAGGDVRRALPS